MLYLVKINNFIIVLIYVLLTLTCNSADKNLEQERLPSYKEAQKSNQIQQCLSALKKPPPDYAVVAYSKELNDLAVGINLNENNNNLNNDIGTNNILSFINKYQHGIYRNFSICWFLSFIATTIVISLLTKSIIIMFVAAICFCAIHYGVTRLCVKERYTIDS